MSIDPELVAEVRLSMVAGIGPRHRAALIEAFGSPGAVLSAASGRLMAVPGIGPKLAQKVCAAGEIDAEGQLQAAAEHGIRVLLPSDPEYPARLREIDDPPAVLYVLGQVLPRDERAVAVVGSRHATRYGKQQAERLAAGLAAAGVTVVSGLARGVDGAAHRGALGAGGRTLAVLAGGLLRLYPPEHRVLAGEVTASGCLISEAPPTMPPLSGAFPQRNRVISGMTLATVVVEAGDRSGALITAKHAAEQGRDVLAVPGPIDSRLSRGCHGLIRDGAKLVAGVDDILEELEPFATAAATHGEPPRAPAVELNDVERRVFEAVESAPTDIDTLVEVTGLPVHRVLATLSVLEMRRVIQRISGNHVTRGDPSA